MGGEEGGWVMAIDKNRLALATTHTRFRQETALDSMAKVCYQSDGYFCPVPARSARTCFGAVVGADAEVRNQQ